HLGVSRCPRPMPRAVRGSGTPFACLPGRDAYSCCKRETALKPLERTLPRNPFVGMEREKGRPTKVWTQIGSSRRVVAVERWAASSPIRNAMNNDAAARARLPLRLSRPRSEGPCEARQRLARGHAAGPDATSNEECRRLRRCSDREASSADALGPPAVGEAQD